MAENIEYTTTGKPHPYHLVRPSIWPLLSAIAGGLLATGGLLYLHDVHLFADPATGFEGHAVGLNGVYAGVLCILIVMFGWWRQVIHETVSEKAHNAITEIGLRYGMALFIGSEVMFFVAFFWAYFNASFFPTEQIGFVWPPASIHTINPFDLPLMMTFILLLSGCTVTWAHHAILEGKNKQAIQALACTVSLGVFFLGFQIYEYANSHFAFTDGIYASTFFMATGFHGFHVFVGTVFLFVCWVRAQKGHFTPKEHFGFEAAAWYWHFVDVVWLFLFIAIYYWGTEFGMDLNPPAAIRIAA